MTSNEQHAANAGRTPQARSSGLVANELTQWLGDWYFAWCWRRKMRRLLSLESAGQVRLGSARERVSAGARMPLAMIAARQADWRRKGDVAD
ncbi:hypothetical protein SAMN05216588_12231 [Pseudomonas flavescens]|uniref:Uncharacterized protein n=1 Tax=Phytopseudomonas flavescens TaxID=29435 RepID=A0A1G8MN73_9GAMM|nr:hypothetical protein [Pseudomonas flavescens]SDI69469.1 hypothetical protein SAMN05216588_12231 [Pseudomonas flavescens]